MRAAILNPIKFYTVANLPNYTTLFPTMDNAPFGAKWVYGVNASPWFVRVHVGVMYLQFETEVADNKTISVYKLGTNGVFGISSTITPTDISPVGWTGKKIYQYTLNLADGIYYLTTATGLQSDYFKIVSSSEESEDYVKLLYYNSENDFGCILVGHYLTAYLVGQLVSGTPKNEYSQYEDDRGEPIKLNATPQRTATLNLKGVHYTYLDLINHIFSCDHIEVNGVQYDNDEAPTVEDIEGSDLKNVQIKLTQSTNDYYYG